MKTKKLKLKRWASTIIYLSIIAIVFISMVFISNQLEQKYGDRVNLSYIFKELINDDVPVLVTSGTEAELIKLYSNAFLALRVAFFNEIDTYAELENLNSKRIIQGVSLDPRVGNFYNIPSFGYGGYCLPKDTRELQYIYNDVPSAVIPSLVHSNVIRKKYIAESIIKLIEKIAVSEPLIGIYRLNMKRDSDNFREAAILDIIDMLMDSGYQVVVFEPIRKQLEGYSFTFVDDLKEFKKMSSIIVANRI